MEPAGSGLAWREAGPPDGDPVLLVHGFPESSYMWRDVLPALGDAGWRAVAPDLAGFGDSPPDPSGTWERHIERLEEFREQLDIDTCVLVVHDWGGLIGLRWACDNAGAATALVISSSGYFPDGRWHGLAETMRTAGVGEQLMADLTRDAFAELLDHSSVGIDESAVGEYWKAFADERRREGPSRALPLRGLREARALRGRTGRARRAGAARLGRPRRVLPRGRGPPPGPRAAGGRDSP